MIKDYRLLLVVSVIAFIFTGLAVTKGMRSEFAKHQREYYGLCDVDEYKVEIKQINVNVGGKVVIDRCTSCHIGFDNPDAINFEQPLTAHPVIVPGADQDPHNFGKIGCMACHDGNGRGTSLEDAHGHFHLWPAPLLSGSQVQSNCIRCHDTNTQPLAGAPELNHGRRLFMEKSCWSCHTIAGVSSGKMGPDLTRAGELFSMDYLRESIVHPTANIDSSRMPEFSWTDDDEIVDALTIYLKSQRLNRYKDYSLAPIGVEKPELAFAESKIKSIADGRKIFMGEQEDHKLRRGGCINCHSVRESDGIVQGGHVGPELTYAGRARDVAYITDHIRNSKSHAPDSVMPDFSQLSDTAVRNVIEYLKSLDYVDTDAIQGAQLYKTYCSSCHGDDLQGRGDNYKLLDPYPRNLSRRQFVESYKERFANSIAEGIKGTAMPPWKDVLSKKQINTIVDFIAKQSSQPKSETESTESTEFVRLQTPLPSMGDMDRISEQPVVASDPVKGKTAFEKHCVGCHGKLANGKGPNAYTLGNVFPRNFLNKEFMGQEIVDDERLYRSILLGVPGTPMPSHSHLADQTVLDLIAYLRTLTK